MKIISGSPYPQAVLQCTQRLPLNATAVMVLGPKSKEVIDFETIFFTLLQVHDMDGSGRNMLVFCTTNRYFASVTNGYILMLVFLIAVYLLPRDVYAYSFVVERNSLLLEKFWKVERQPRSLSVCVTESHGICAMIGTEGVTILITRTGQVVDDERSVGAETSEGDGTIVLGSSLSPLSLQCSLSGHLNVLDPSGLVTK